MGKFDKYQYLVTAFNNKYGLDFSYEEYETTVLKNQNLASVFAMEKKSINMENRVYISKFGAMYKKAFTNFLDKKIENFSTEQMLKDYRTLMKGYRSARKEANNPLEQNWVASSYLIESAKENIKTIPGNKPDYVEERYLKGELRIRDMRAEVKRLMSMEGEKTPEILAVVLGYSEALKCVNVDRPLWWRWIHPFRNAAEQRESENFANVVKSLVGDYAVAAFTAGYKKTFDIMLDGTIKNTRSEVADLAERLKAEEITGDAQKADKQKVEVKEINKEEAGKLTEQIKEKDVPSKNDIILN